MSRRRLVVLASAIAILIIGIAASGLFLSVTRTDYGREQIRGLLQHQLAGAVDGKVYVGHLSGSFVTSLSIDSLEIRDRDDSIFLATGPVSVTYDPRDIVDKRILLRDVEVAHPVFTLRHSDSTDWNWRRVFRQKRNQREAPRRGRGFGDFIVAYGATVRDASFTLRLPWHPDDSLRGARRDSAIAANLARTDRDIRRTKEGYIRSWYWRAGDIVSSYVRLADPDSAGKYFDVDSLSVLEFDPPFAFRNAHGGVKLLGDSLWLQLAHFDLPASTGGARGKIVWGSDLPIRYDIHVRGDSVSLRDVVWVYPTLPTSGGGKMELAIRSERNPSLIDYAITKMDVRSLRSRLTGNMTYGVGGPMLVVKDVELQASPLDFTLIRQLNGKPFPYDWQGQLYGSVTAKGGPLNRFVVDDATFTFRDAHVPGAVSSGSAAGELDIYQPALTAFHGLDVKADRIDLRTPEFLNPNFPRLGGWVSGTARLDSSWLDLWFTGADLTHHDGADEPSRFTGNGRVTWGALFLTYDLDLQAAPLSFTTLARSYPALPMRGAWRGPLRVQGTMENLDLSTSLAGAAGTIGVDGHFDLFPPGFLARGTLTLAGLDIRQLLEDSRAVSTSLGGTVRYDLKGDSVPLLQGAVAADLDRSLVDGVRLYPSSARMRFGDRRVMVDTLTLESAAGRLRAWGALGLSAERSDSLHFSYALDSLGGLRRYLGPTADVGPGGRLAEGSPASSDSLSGSLSARGTVTGSIASFGVRGDLEGQNLVMATSQASALRGLFSVGGLPRASSGTLAVQLDTVRLGSGSLVLARMSAGAEIIDSTHARVAVGATSANGPRLNASAQVAFAPESTLWTVDTLGLQVGPHGWNLERPSHVTVTRAGVTLDTLRLRGSAPAGGWLALHAGLPDSSAVSISLGADSVPLADVGLLMQASAPFAGLARFEWRVTGTRTAPTMQITSALTGAQFGGTRLDFITMRGDYAGRRLDAAATLFRGGTPALRVDGRLPLDLSLIPVAQRVLVEPLTGRIRSDTVDFSLVEIFSPALQRARGRMALNADVAGTIKHPKLTGALTVSDGELFLPAIGVGWQRIGADIGFHGDSVAINRLTIGTGGERPGSLTVLGSLSFADWQNPRFDVGLTARNFHAVNRVRVADLDLSTPGGRALRLVGSRTRATLAGGVDIPRGEITIPELFNKKVLSLDDPEARSLVDTTLDANRRLLPGAPDTLVQNLTLDNVTIGMGEDVWLRSAEANIKLGGSVNVRRGSSDRAGAPEQLALQGTLRADRGTYRLNLGALQRTFDIERGSLIFAGDPDLNPELDIRANYTVRPFGRSEARQDVKVVVVIKGTLAQPTLGLTVADKEGSESDALSYLVTGEPSYGVGGQGGPNLETVFSAGYSTIGALLAGKISGGAVDVVTLQTAGFDESYRGARTGDYVRGGLAGTRVGAGKQIGNRTFVSANLGLCQLGQATSGQGVNAADLASSIGGRVEYRLSDNYSVAAALEPPSIAQSCGIASTTSVQRPRQVGFDLFRAWQF
jgi:translocation and assembly module TamB